MNHLFISFVVPIYNTEKYLDECLESLVNQDLPDNDYEIICINDGSTDGSETILKKYRKKYKNIKIITIENGGVSNARNLGIEVAEGEYIWMVDSDDFILTNILMSLKNVAETYSPDIIDFGAYCYYEQMTKTEYLAYQKHELLVSSFANNVYITRSLFKRDFLKKIDIRFDIRISYGEDSLFKSTCLVHKPDIYLIEKAYYFVRFREGSALSSDTEESRNKKIVSLNIVTEKFKKYYCNCAPELKSSMADLLMSNLWMLLAVLAKLPSTEAKPYLNDLKKKGLFPYKRPSECTLSRSYSTNRTDFIGKVYDKIYTHLNTYIGFYLMQIWCRMYDLHKSFSHK